MQWKKEKKSIKLSAVWISERVVFDKRTWRSFDKGSTRNRKKQWEERNKGKKNNEKGVFKPTTTSIEQLPQEQKDLLSNMYSEAQVKNLMNEEKYSRKIRCPYCPT